MDLFPSAANLYRLLLFAYPAEFRHEYGPQMEELFAQRLMGEPRVRVWLETLADLVTSAPREQANVFGNDLRYAARTFAKTPGFTATALLTIALGIGATTAMFSVLDAVLLKSLPYAEPERLVYLRAPIPSFKLPPWAEFAPAIAEFYQLEKSNRSFTRMAMFSSASFEVGGVDEGEKIAGARVTEGFFPTLGVAPEMGRTITEDDDKPGGGHVAVIGYSLWQRIFGGAPDAIGKQIRLDRQPYTVIGVMPPSFAYPRQFEDRSESKAQPAEIWTPAGLTAKERQDRNVLWGDVIARMRPGVSIRQAQAEMANFISQAAALRVPFFQNAHAAVRSFTDEAVGEVRPLLWLLMGAVSLVLLIAASNVAGLLLARASERVGEMGLRSALGADRRRLVRQVLTEALALSAAGGILGVLFAYGALRLLVSLEPSSIPRLNEISLDGRILGFTLTVSCVTGLLFGAYPAVWLSRSTLMDLLKRSGNKGVLGAAGAVRNLLIVAEISLALVLLTGSGLLIRSFLKLEGLDAGFSGKTLTGRIELDDRYNAEPQQREFFSRLLSQLQNEPALRSAGLITNLPLSHSGTIRTFDVEGYANEQRQVVASTSATGSYFQAMHIPPLRGRLFNDSDRAGQPQVLVVNESFAAKYFHGREALGGRVYFSRGTGGQPFWTIVGIVRDVRAFSLEATPVPLVYQSFWQAPSRNSYLTLETAATPEQAVREVKASLHTLDGAIHLTDVATMAKLRSRSEDSHRYQAMLLALFSASALALSLVGLYALISHSVRVRKRELAVRVALGATASEIKAMVMKQALGLTAVGLLCGLLGAAGLTRYLSSMLFETPALDAGTFTAVPVLFLIVAAAAAWIPAQRAASVDPAQAFRSE